MTTNETGAADWNDPILSRYHDAISTANSQDDLRTAVRQMLQLCQESLQAVSPSRQMALFFEAAHILAKLPGDFETWAFIGHAALEADEIRKEALRIAFLELIPDPPVNLDDLFQLWRLGADPTTAWVLDAAYLHQPERRRPHRDLYQKYCQETGL